MCICVPATCASKQIHVLTVPAKHRLCEEKQQVLGSPRGRPPEPGCRIQNSPGVKPGLSGGSGRDSHVISSQINSAGRVACGSNDCHLNNLHVCGSSVHTGISCIYHIIKANEIKLPRRKIDFQLKDHYIMTYLLQIFLRKWPWSNDIACIVINTLRPRQNGQHFAEAICKRIFFNENVWISIKISLKFVPKGPINKIPALFQIMAWRRPGDKPLSEAMLVSLLTHKCVTRPQWVKVWINIHYIFVPLYL